MTELTLVPEVTKPDEPKSVHVIPAQPGYAVLFIEWDYFFEVNENEDDEGLGLSYNIEKFPVIAFKISGNDVYAVTGSMPDTLLEPTREEGNRHYPIFWKPEAEIGNGLSQLISVLRPDGKVASGSVIFDDVHHWIRTIKIFEARWRREMQESEAAG